MQQFSVGLATLVGRRSFLCRVTSRHELLLLQLCYELVVADFLHIDSNICAQNFNNIRVVNVQCICDFSRKPPKAAR